MMPFYLDELIKTALQEDIPYLDVSSEFLFDTQHKSRACYIAKADGVLAGLSAAMRVFVLLDEAFVPDCKKQDGDTVTRGETIALLHGKTRALLQGERTALNLVQHLSGIASMTARAVQAVAGTGARIVDTRKTLPGLRALQKYAVLCGGGKNHRFCLSDAAMLKDTHIDAAGGIAGAVTRIRENVPHTTTIEVETRNLTEVEQALAAGADCIMLDNMHPDELREAVKLVNGRVPLEASGNITLENLRAVAETGVDIISIGALTHSVQAFDISMKMCEG